MKHKKLIVGMAASLVLIIGLALVSHSYLEDHNRKVNTSIMKEMAPSLDKLIFNTAEFTNLMTDNLSSQTSSESLTYVQNTTKATLGDNQQIRNLMAGKVSQQLDDMRGRVKDKQAFYQAFSKLIGIQTEQTTLLENIKPGNQKEAVKELKELQSQYNDLLPTFKATQVKLYAMTSVSDPRKASDKALDEADKSLLSEDDRQKLLNNVTK